MITQDVATVNEDGLVVVDLSDVEPEDVEWIWPGRIPRGKLTNLVGDPELLKTTIAIDLAARVTTGKEMPDGTESDLDGPAGVVFLMGEDGVADTIRPRIDAAGGDPERVSVVTQVKQGERRRQIAVQKDADKLLKLVEEKDAALVVFDPLTAYLGGASTHKDAPVRTALAPLLDMTAKAHVATLAIRHLNKNEDAENTLYRSGGSIAFTAVARSELLVGEQEDGTKALASQKMNLTEKPPALGYEAEAADNGQVRVKWNGEAPATPADLLNGSGTLNKRDVARRFLLQKLSSGPMLADTIKADAEAFGISESTLRRAKDELGVEADKDGLGPWKWRLPEEDEGG